VSRGLTFWNDETIKLIRERFVAVAVPTWVARAEGPEGKFLRSAGIDKHWVTSSGYMHCVSPGGTLLGGRPTDAILAEFDNLPPSERQPGAIAVPPLKPGEELIPAPPAGGLVLNVHARFLSEDSDGSARPARVEDFPLLRDNPDLAKTWRLFLEPNTECLWLTKDEWQALVPEQPAVGQRIEVDPAIAMRMARFHLNPQRATTSEGGILGVKEVRTAELELVVDEVSPESLTMRLQGAVAWGSAFDAALATTPNGPLPMGYAAPLHGRLAFDRRDGIFTRFDVVASGSIWGRWGDANGKSLPVERPGKSPFGFALELATGASPTERIPPGGNGRYVTELHGYFGTAP
jgi:hypothetical protein